MFEILNRKLIEVRSIGMNEPVHPLDQFTLLALGSSKTSQSESPEIVNHELPIIVAKA